MVTLRTVKLTALALCAGLVASAMPSIASATSFPFRSLDTSSLASAVVRPGERVRGPSGFYAFCRAHADQCLPQQGQLEVNSSGAVVATQGLIRELSTIQRSVNRRIRAEHDHVVHGMEDLWTLGARVGDCEDFAVEKRHQLLAQGWPSSALILALGHLPSGEGHAVLIARTDRGDVVLDNLEEDIVPLGSHTMRLHSVTAFDMPLRIVRATSVRL